MQYVPYKISDILRAVKICDILRYDTVYIGRCFAPILINLLPQSCTLKTEVTSSSEKLVAISETVWRHNPHDRTVNEIIFDRKLTLLTSLETPSRMALKNILGTREEDSATLQLQN